MPVLEVHQLSKTFGKTVALHPIDLTLERGEALGLLGANGAGKTTAMHAILGLIEPSSGSIHLFGQPLAHHRRQILARCNFSSSYSGLPGNLAVEENLKVFASLYKVKDAKKRIQELLDLFEISHLRKRVTGKLSAGESTRVGLAKALLNRPELLLLDEPTASLDPEIADKVRTTLTKIQHEEGIALLYTSHNMRDIEQICQRVVFLHHGRIAAEGSPRDIATQFGEVGMEEVFIKIVRGTPAP